MIEIDKLLPWIERAEEDFAIARSALHRKTPLIYPACFHAQQCVEKYLKAILTSKNIPCPKTHDLLMLFTICEESSILIPIETKDLNTLNDYSVRVRYPGDYPTVDDAKEALIIANNIRRFSRKVLGIK